MKLEFSVIIIILLIFDINAKPEKIRKRKLTKPRFKKHVKLQTVIGRHKHIKAIPQTPVVIPKTVGVHSHLVHKSIPLSHYHVSAQNYVHIARIAYCPKQLILTCLLYTSPSPRDRQKSRMPSSA